MGWETRGGRRYYYRKVWKSGRCFSVYEGGGLAGELSAGRDEAERDEARRIALDARAELATFDAVDAEIDRAWALVREATARELEAAGYHRHRRQWRRRRGAPASKLRTESP